MSQNYLLKTCTLLIVFFYTLSACDNKPINHGNNSDKALKRIHEMIEIVNSKDEEKYWNFVEKSFSQKLNETPKEQHLYYFNMLCEKSKGLEFFQIFERESNGISVILKNKSNIGYTGMYIRVSEEIPYLIEDFKLRDVTEEQIEAIKKKLN